MENEKKLGIMDPTLNKHPVLSYVLSQQNSNSHPPLPLSLSILFPQLTNPKVISSLTQAIPASISQTHFMLTALGPRPDPDDVSKARSSLAQMQESGETEKDAGIYKAVVRMEEMHEEYERQAMGAEEKLIGVYKNVAGEADGDEGFKEEMHRILQEALSGKAVETADFSGRQLSMIPEALGKLNGLLVLNLSRNQLKALPDSIAGLVKLQQLNVSSNFLVSLPDSIGLLRGLKVLNVSGNKLTTLPMSIALCSSLVEMDASFNNLVSLPSNIGYGLVHLERLSIQLNKIRYLPPNIAEMKSLKYLDAHLNELHGLPHAIGRLTNLEVLNLSSNFGNLTELPETIGDLTKLKQLDLSNNQIRALPDTFGRLEKLTKVNLAENPLLIPPKEVVNQGTQAVREYMAKLRLDKIAVEQQRIMSQAIQQEPQPGWFSWGSSWNNFVSGFKGEKDNTDSYLDDQL